MKNIYSHKPETDTPYPFFLEDKDLEDSIFWPFIPDYATCDEVELIIWSINR